MKEAQKVDIETAQVNLLMEINGEIHLVGGEREKMEAVTNLAKLATTTVVPTGRSQKELREFLGL